MSERGGGDRPFFSHRPSERALSAHLSRQRRPPPAGAVLNSALSGPATLPPIKMAAAETAQLRTWATLVPRGFSAQFSALLCFASCSTNRIAVAMAAFPLLLTGALAAAPAYAAVAQS